MCGSTLRKAEAGSEFQASLVYKVSPGHLKYKKPARQREKKRKY